MGIEITDVRVLPAGGGERDALVEVMANAITDAANIDTGDLDYAAAAYEALRDASDRAIAVSDEPDVDGAWFVCVDRETGQLIRSWPEDADGKGDPLFGGPGRAIVKVAPIRPMRERAEAEVRRLREALERANRSLQQTPAWPKDIYDRVRDTGNILRAALAEGEQTAGATAPDDLHRALDEARGSSRANGEALLRMRTRANRYREALERYAEMGNWSGFTFIDATVPHRIARAALAEGEQPEGETAIGGDLKDRVQMAIYNAIPFLTCSPDEAGKIATNAARSVLAVLSSEPAAGVQSTTETDLLALLDRAERTGSREVVEWLRRQVDAVRRGRQDDWASTTETATHHEYSLIDAVLPAEGERRFAQIQMVSEELATTHPAETLGTTAARILDALREAAAPATPESGSNDAR